MTSHPQPAGRFARGLKIGRLGLSLTGSYLGYQMQNLFGGEEGKAGRRKEFERKTSRKLREELQSLKGAVMKVGQALSMQNHLLSAEVTEELARLQMRAPPMHPSLARAQFKASTGKFPEDLFREFDPAPLAARLGDKCIVR